MSKFGIFFSLLVFVSAILAKSFWQDLDYKNSSQEQDEGVLQELSRDKRQTGSEAQAMYHYYSAANILKQNYKDYLDDYKGSKWTSILTKAKGYCDSLSRTYPSNDGWFGHAKRRCQRATEYMDKTKDASSRLCPYNNFVYQMSTKYKAGVAFKKFTCGDIDACKRSVDIIEIGYDDIPTISNNRDGRTSYSICKTGFSTHLRNFPTSNIVESNQAAAKSLLGCHPNFVQAYPNSTFEKCPDKNVICGFKVLSSGWGPGCCIYPPQLTDEPKFIEDQLRKACPRFQF